MWQKSKNIYHLINAFLAKSWYQNPARDMIVIGVTGTDGKTTTAFLIYHILEKLGYKAALISTVSAIINGKEFDTGSHVSTPGSRQLQSYMQKAKQQGATHLVLEVTSHGLDQNRVFGIPFSIGVLTNISREHLDYHKSLQNYMEAKGKLLKSANTVVLNQDDDSYGFFKKHLIGKKIVTYGLAKSSDINPENTAVKTRLEGEYNLYNTLAAIAALTSLGIKQINMIQPAKTFLSPEGRFEIVYENDFKVIIDFAHTPNALEKVLQTASRAKKHGKLIHVFGAAGERDRGKRSIMGEKSSEFADIIILTAEDPRKENVLDIIRDIRKGIAENKTVVVIPDRQEAINQAITLAQKNDIVIITGKGHEKSMNMGKGEEAWDEYEAVKNALKYKKQVKALLA